MARRRRFKSKSLQETYDWFRANKPGPEIKTRGATGNAYYVGRYVNQSRPFGQRGSVTYAAWAAGIDDASEESSPPSRKATGG